jgi:hypothetical protein
LEIFEAAFEMLELPLKVLLERPGIDDAMQRTRLALG